MQGERGWKHVFGIDTLGVVEVRNLRGAPTD
jgi:hypothetical protein